MLNSRTACSFSKKKKKKSVTFYVTLFYSLLGYGLYTGLGSGWLPLGSSHHLGMGWEVFAQESIDMFDASGIATGMECVTEEIQGCKAKVLLIRSRD